MYTHIPKYRELTIEKYAHDFAAKITFENLEIFLLESLRKTVKLLQDDIVTKKRKIDHLEGELRIANKAARHFEVRIVNE